MMLGGSYVRNMTAENCADMNGLTAVFVSMHCSVFTLWMTYVAFVFRVKKERQLPCITALKGHLKFVSNVVRWKTQERSTAGESWRGSDEENCVVPWCKSFRKETFVLCYYTVMNLFGTETGNLLYEIHQLQIFFVLVLVFVVVEEELCFFNNLWRRRRRNAHLL